jgi:hypothetical protein
VELYSPSGGNWSAAASLLTAREYHSATVLGNGAVLIAGGGDASGAYLSSAELYNSSTNTWSSTGSLVTARIEHTAVLLAGNQVLIAGGINNNTVGYLASSELYDTAAMTWSATGSMATPRVYHTETLLATGQVLVTGGQNNNGYIASVELYTPAPASCTVTVPSNASLGNCPAVLSSGSSCQLACSAGYTLTGPATTCQNGTLSTQTCVPGTPSVPAMPTWAVLSLCLGVVGSGIVVLRPRRFAMKAN